MKTYYTLTCGQTGETQIVIVCAEHSKGMPQVDGKNIQAQPADDDVECKFCRPQVATINGLDPAMMKALSNIESGTLERSPALLRCIRAGLVTATTLLPNDYFMTPAGKDILQVANLALIGN